MTKIAVAAIALLSLAACSKPAPTTENAANAVEADLVNKAAALDAEADADTNAAAQNAINGASAAYNNSVGADAGATTNAQ